MTRAQLAHLLRMASTITSTSEVIVLGSQAILGTYDEDDLPEAAVGSVEADLSFFSDDDNEKSDLVDGRYGEDSAFHAEHGCYAQGVNIGVAHLPAGWQQRLVTLPSEAALPGVGQCLEPHDLVVSKLVAGRTKDIEFCAALIKAGLVKPSVLVQRTNLLADPAPVRRRIIRWIESAAETYSNGS